MASMGPRALARGNNLQRVLYGSNLGSFNGAARSRARKFYDSGGRVLISLPASMGPRALARGNPPSPAVHSTVATRFNGAARSRARKCLHAVQTALKLDGFNGAARSRARKWRGQSRGAGIREALQWGRALSRAEMDHRETTTVETCFASMGPRALARGNIAFDDI